VQFYQGTVLPVAERFLFLDQDVPREYSS